MFNEIGTGFNICAFKKPESLVKPEVLEERIDRYNALEEMTENYKSMFATNKYVPLRVACQEIFGFIVDRIYEYDAECFQLSPCDYSRVWKAKEKAHDQLSTEKFLKGVDKYEQETLIETYASLSALSTVKAFVRKLNHREKTVLRNALKNFIDAPELNITKISKLLKIGFMKNYNINIKNVDIPKEPNLNQAYKNMHLISDYAKMLHKAS